MFHAAIAAARSYQMKTRALILMTAFLLTVFVFPPTADARLFTARLMAEDQQTLTWAQPADSTDSMVSADKDDELSSESAARLAELADLYRSRGLYFNAEVIVKDLVAMRQRVLGADNPEIAGYLTNLADIYCAKKDYARAEPLYLQSLAIREKSLGLHHRDVATNLKNLADLYLEQGRYQEAQPLYARALAILEEVLRPDHPDVTAVRASYAALLAASARSVVKVREPDISMGSR
jgi:tetratricopeptide (TPR) repeat protein